MEMVIQMCTNEVVLNGRRMKKLFKTFTKNSFQEPTIAMLQYLLFRFNFVQTKVTDYEGDVSWMAEILHTCSFVIECIIS